MNDQNFNMQSWASKIPENFTELRKCALESKVDLPYTLEALGLPCYNSTRLPLDEFLDNPQDTIDKVPSNRYWLQFIPKDAATPRETYLDIKHDDLFSFVKKSSRMKFGSYTLYVSEYANNLYGGNIVIGQSGNVLVEFSHGLQSKVASENEIPEYTAISTYATNTLNYSFKDTELRSKIWNLIRLVRHMPGYFEFTILDKEEGERPIFLDARLTNPIYQIVD